MGTIVGSLNMTLDGICDHTAGIADADLHQHFSKLLAGMDQILYGRKTYELMRYWQTVLTAPTGVEALDEFASVIDKITKIVFSTTLTTTGWQTAKLATAPLLTLAQNLKAVGDKRILAGSRSIILQLLDAGLLDELQLCIHPFLQKKGLRFFENLEKPFSLQLLDNKVLKSGVVVLTYSPTVEGKI